jgi:ATP-dependent DNA ligase
MVGEIISERWARSSRNDGRLQPESALHGQDLRGMPLGDRKKRLARLLGGRRLGIVLSDHTDDDGATIFRPVCRMGLEGIVSKRLSAPYRSGPSRDWIKVKNPDSPAGSVRQD